MSWHLRRERTPGGGTRVTQFCHCDPGWISMMLCLHSFLLATLLLRWWGSLSEEGNVKAQTEKASEVSQADQANNLIFRSAGSWLPRPEALHPRPILEVTLIPNFTAFWIFFPYARVCSGTGSHSVAQAILKHTVVLPPLLTNCWDDSCVPPHPAFKLFS